MDISRNYAGKQTALNNIENQKIPALVSADHLEDKVTDNFKSSNLFFNNKGINGYLKINNANPKNVMTRYVKRKFCNQILETK